MTKPISSADAVAWLYTNVQSGYTEVSICPDDHESEMWDKQELCIKPAPAQAIVLLEPVTYWDLSENAPPIRPSKWNAAEYPNHAPLYLRAALQAKLWREQQAADKFEGLMIDAQLRVDEHLKDKVALGARAQLQEDTARHVRFVLGEHAEVCTERDKLLARVVDLEKDRNDFAKYIARETPLGADDWACSRCHPNSEILKSGFVCDAHRAIDIDAAMKGAQS
jgi:hypothetical protein